MNTSIVPGSVAAIAQQTGKSIAESFLSVDAIVIVDVSGSMMDTDTPTGQSRYNVACDELKALQANMPGKIAVISFSDTAKLEPGGIPTFEGMGTDMVVALQFAHVADGLGIKLILISDGYPNDPEGTLTEAKKFKTKIDTIYIGGESDSAGRKFLRQLAAATGGTFAKSAAPAMLAAPVIRLLTSHAS